MALPRESRYVNQVVSHDDCAENEFSLHLSDGSEHFDINPLAKRRYLREMHLIRKFLPLTHPGYCVPDWPTITNA
jgi:hypothetical protein